jgi:hypothetical protein
MRTLIITLLGLMCLVAATTAYPSIFLLSKNWLLTCKPCDSALEECSSCIKDSCNQCVSEIVDSNCRRCGSDILKQNSDSFYCDESVPMHQKACRISCRSRNVTPYFRDGSCNANTGVCDCCKSFF